MLCLFFFSFMAQYKVHPLSRARVAEMRAGRAGRASTAAAAKDLAWGAAAPEPGKGEQLDPSR